MRIYLVTALYIVSIVAANLAVTIFGPGSILINAFLFIALDFTTRDYLQEAWRGRGLKVKMALLIAAGAALSYILNASSSVALASFLAFTVASAIDTLIYSLFNKRGWLIRSNASNLTSTLFDSIIFQYVAFGSLAPGLVLGQWAVKTLGGLFWSFIIYRAGKQGKQGKRGEDGNLLLFGNR